MEPWVLALLGALITAAVVSRALWLRRQPRHSSIGILERGAFAAMREAVLGRAEEWSQELGVSPTTTQRGEQPPRAVLSTPNGPNRSAFLPASAAGGAEAAAFAADWAVVDQRVLEGYGRYVGDETAGLLDLYRDALGRTGSNLNGWVTGLRGHAGEQEVFAQLETWLGGDLSVPASGSNPGFDLQIAGYDANVKVTGDVARTAAEHFGRYPDVPLIVNADAPNIPASAVHVDLSAPFDASMLDEENLIIVAEGLELGGLGAAIGDVAGFGEIGGAVDGLPGIGIVIAAARSGLREGKLLAIHQDKGRFARIVATDAALVGGGALVGIKAGAAAGAAVEGMLGGFGLGIPTLIGAALGGFGGGAGGKKVATLSRTKELRSRQRELTAALEAYGATLDEVERITEAEWTEVRTRVERSVDVARDDLDRVREAVVAEAGTALSLTHAISPVRRQELLADGLNRVDRAVALEGSPLARRRARAWRAAARRAGDDLDAVMDVVLASPGGIFVATELIEEASHARRRGLAVLAAGRELIQAGAVRARTAAAETVDAERTRLQESAHEALAAPIRAVEAASRAVEAEAAALGIGDPPSR